MRKQDFLKIAGACAFGLLATFSPTSTASAFGLSDRQKAHVDEYIHCKILLLTDLAAFAADPACGGTPNIDLKSMASGLGNGGKKRPVCDYPTYSLTSISEYICEYDQ